MLQKILIISIAIFSYKLITCISELIRITYYRNLYMQFIKHDDDSFKQYTKLSVDLMKKLGIKESFTNGGISPVLGNITMKNGLIIPHVQDKFESAVGIAKYNLKQCFNPIYWLNLILFLPKNILVYLNVPTESIFIRIAQVVYWVLSTLITMFSSDIAEWLKSFIHF